MTESANSRPPALVATVVDTEDARGLAEFYRELFGLVYRDGDEPPAAGEPDPKGQEWLVPPRRERAEPAVVPADQALAPGDLAGGPAAADAAPGHQSA